MGRPGAGRPPAPTVRMGWPGVGRGFSTGGGASYLGRSGATGTIRRRPPVAPGAPAPGVPGVRPEGACGATLSVGVRKRCCSGAGGCCSPPGCPAPGRCGVTARGEAGVMRGADGVSRGAGRTPGCAGGVLAGAEGAAGVEGPAGAESDAGAGGRGGRCCAAGGTGGAGALYTGRLGATGILGPGLTGEPAATGGAGRIEGWIRGGAWVEAPGAAGTGRADVVSILDSASLGGADTLASAAGAGGIVVPDSGFGASEDTTGGTADTPAGAAAGGTAASPELAGAGAVEPPFRYWRTLSATSSSTALECVLCSVNPTAISASRTTRDLTSSSLARSLILIFPIRLRFFLRAHRLRPTGLACTLLSHGIPPQPGLRAGVRNNPGYRKQRQGRRTVSAMGTGNLPSGTITPDHDYFSASGDCLLACDSSSVCRSSAIEAAESAAGSWPLSEGTSATSAASASIIPLTCSASSV